MSNWTKLTKEEFEISKEIIGLTKTELQIRLIRSIDYIKNKGISCLYSEDYDLLEILEGGNKNE